MRGRGRFSLHLWRRLLHVAKETIARRGADSDAGRSISSAADLLCALLVQDVKDKRDGKAEIRKGVAKDRVVSVTDPEMRHGRKSSSQRFDGHKAVVAADAETGLITDLDVLPGNAHDSEKVLEVVERSEEAMGEEVEKTIGDCAYGTGRIRREFADCGREIVAKVPRPPRTGKFTKDDFKIDLENDRVTCPAGHICSDFQVVWIKSRVAGNKQKTKRFTFDTRTCLACPLRAKCVKGSAGRTITLHPQEGLMQKARDFQRRREFRKEYSLRVVIEHRIARLIQLGIRKSRFFGRRKTTFQLLMAAAVANLTLIANAAGPMGAFVSGCAVMTLFLSLISALSKREERDNRLSAA
jgi:hypothetical protein